MIFVKNLDVGDGALLVLSNTETFSTESIPVLALAVGLVQNVLIICIFLNADIIVAPFLNSDVFESFFIYPQFLDERLSALGAVVFCEIDLLYGCMM